MPLKLEWLEDMWDQGSETIRWSRSVNSRYMRMITPTLTRQEMIGTKKMICLMQEL